MSLTPENVQESLLQKCSEVRAAFFVPTLSCYRALEYPLQVSKQGSTLSWARGLQRPWKSMQNVDRLHDATLTLMIVLAVFLRKKVPPWSQTDGLGRSQTYLANDGRSARL